MMTFKEWLQLREVGFGTNCVATFSLPIGMGTRDWPPPIEDSEWKSPHEKEHKKHKHKKKEK